jgi:hypothetical protein
VPTDAKLIPEITTKPEPDGCLDGKTKPTPNGFKFFHSNPQLDQAELKFKFGAHPHSNLIKCKM